MKKLLFYPAAALMLTAGMFVQSCSKVSDDAGLPRETRAAPPTTDLVPIADIRRIGSVDLLEANPLNAGIYFINDSIPFYNVVMFNRVHITEGPGWNVFLGWDTSMQKVIDDPEIYIRPLQEQGIKVLLTITGYRANGWGFANLYDKHVVRLSNELVELVAACGFDGIEVEDEWTDYGANNCPMPNPNSYSTFLQTLRQTLPADKVIYVKNRGHISDLKPEAIACIDCVWNATSDYYSPTSYMRDLPKEKWVPLMYDASNSFSERSMQVYVVKMIDDGFRSIAFCWLDETSPVKMFQKFATTAFGEDTVVTQSRETYPNQWWK